MLNNVCFLLERRRVRRGLLESVSLQKQTKWTDENWLEKPTNWIIFITEETPRKIDKNYFQKAKKNRFCPTNNPNTKLKFIFYLFFLFLFFKKKFQIFIKKEFFSYWNLFSFFFWFFFATFFVFYFKNSFFSSCKTYHHTIDDVLSYFEVFVLFRNGIFNFVQRRKNLFQKRCRANVFFAFVNVFYSIKCSFKIDGHVRCWKILAESIG